MIGDADGFGGAFPDVTRGQDHRRAAEAAATDGSQQTDFYGALFRPPSDSFTMVFNIGAPVSHLSLDYRSFGLQVNTFGPISATANGIDVSGLFSYEDGIMTDATHSGAFSAAVIDAINASGNTLSLTLARGTSQDAIAFDYFSVTGATASAAVPEPTTLALSGLAMVALLKGMPATREGVLSAAELGLRS